MKKALLLCLLPLAVTLAGADFAFAQESAPMKEAGEPAPHKARKKKKARKAEAAQPAEQAPEPGAAKPRPKRLPRQPVGTVTAEKPVLKTLDKKKSDSLLYRTMEKLEIVIALNHNLGLQLSEDAANKAAELERAVNNAVAGFYKIDEPDPGRDAIRAYKDLLASTLQGLKAFLDVKDRIIPEQAEKPLALCRELAAAIDDELSGAKLKAPGGAARASAAPARAADDEDDPRLVSAPVKEPETAADGAVSGEAGALATLAEIRKALAEYKRDEGKYPKTLKKLVPKYLPEMPAVSVADHPTTDEVLEIDTEDYDDTLHQAITDSGKWLYFSAKKSKYYGKVFIDCSHKNAAGVELYKSSEGK